MPNFGLMDDEAPSDDRKPIPRYHRKVPREQWTPGFLLKEWKHQMTLLRPDVINRGMDARAFNKVLKQYRTEHGVSVAEVAATMDLFFADRTQVAGLSNEVPAWKVFITYLKRHIDRVRALAPTVSETDPDQQMREAGLL